MKKILILLMIFTVSVGGAWTIEDQYLIAPVDARRYQRVHHALKDAHKIPLENFVQTIDAYVLAGVDNPEVVFAVLSRFNWAVEKNIIYVDGGDVLGGFVNFIEHLSAIDRATRQELLVQLFGANYPTDFHVLIYYFDAMNEIMKDENFRKQVQKKSDAIRDITGEKK